MSALSLELDDRALSLARGGEVLLTTPSARFVEEGRLHEGEAWRFIRSGPTTTSTRHLGTVLSDRAGTGREAALASEELAGLLEGHVGSADESIWLATPARAKSAGLASLLGALRQRSVPIGGFVDAPTAAVAALGLDRSALVLEFGLHHAAATAVDVAAGFAHRRRAVVAEGRGLIELYEAWLDLVGSTMVKRTRFDPLHDASSEQLLFDELPRLAREAVVRGMTAVRVSRGEERFQIELTRDQFAAAAEPVVRNISALLHGLRPAGACLAIVTSAAVAELPGLREVLDQFAGCELVTVPDGFAAAVVSQLELPLRKSDPDSVRLFRKLPALPAEPLAAPAAMVTREMIGDSRSAGSGPSHVLYGGRAYSLDNLPLIVGRATGSEVPPSLDPAVSIVLPEGLAGVSRRHCTLARDNEHVVLLDHSSFGTFVNDERVVERVRLRSGDRVRVGDPGIELKLIAVGDAAATP